MTTAKRQSNDRATGESTIDDYRADLWRMADALRGSMDAADYKHVVLGLIFLKYISDAFEELHTKLEGERDQGADPENRTSIWLRTSFGFLPRLAGGTFSPRRASPPTGRSLILP